MSTSPKIPTSLHIVALLFLVGGVHAIATMVAEWTRGHGKVDLGAIGLLVYSGLVHRTAPCVTRLLSSFALIVLWGHMLIAPILFVLGLGDGNFYFVVLGERLARAAPIWASVIAVPMFLVSLWSYRVLIRPDVRKSFCEPSS